MTVTEAKRTELSERLEACRRQREEIWEAFAQDYGKKAEAVSYLVQLGFSLSPEQVAQMEAAQGIPAASLTAPQQALLAKAEPLMQALGFLGRPGEKPILASMVAFHGNGGTQFQWGPRAEGRGLGINWLPYSQRDLRSTEAFAAAQRIWRERQEWLIRQHYADFRQAADCCRLLLELALTLSPEQVAGMAEKIDIPVPRLVPEQRALVEAAARLQFIRPPGDLSDYAVQFEASGQFWLRRLQGTRTSYYGQGWLPYSWKCDPRATIR